MPKEGNIILTGFMGTGKSEVGKRLAARLGWRFIDTDVLIEQEAGMSITRLFADKGEPHFRGLEQQVITRVSMEKDVVIATGGGTIVNQANADRLTAGGTVICLTATPEVILSRVQGNTNRPLLQGDDPLGKIRMLLQSRADAYARADLAIDTSHLGVDEVVDAVQKALKERGQ